MTNFRKLLDHTSIVLIYGFAFLLPLVFTPLTTEFYESAKFFLLCLVTLVLLILWGLKLFTEGKLEIRRTPIDLFLLLFLITAIVSTAQFFSNSPARYIALFGILPKFHGSLIFHFAVILFYFLTVFNLKDLKQIGRIVNLMIAGGVILAIFTLLTYFKVHSNIPLIGNFAVSAIYLSLILPLTLRLLFSQPALGALINLLFAITLVLTGNFPSWIGAAFATVISSYYYREHLRKIGPSVVLIVIVSGLIGIFSFSPALSNKTPLGKIGSSFQREVQLPFMTSWKISAGAFRDSPVWGTGPSTYLYDFTQYKPLEVNQSPYWNIRVNSAHDYYLQTWAELGSLGILLLLGIAVSFILFAIKNPDQYGLTSAGLVFLLLMALSPLTILTQTAGFLILALAIATGGNKQELEVNLSGNRGFHPLVSVLTFLPIITISALGFYFIGKLAIGEFYHRNALTATTQNQAVEVYNNLVKAERINPYADIYRTDLAQTNFALANAIASQKGPTEASPGGSLTDDDRKNIQQLLSQAITEGRSAVAIAPRSAGNWEILAAIYRQISGVSQNALQFSLDSYGHAIGLDPLNPVLRLSVGGVYFQLKNYDLAIRFFDDAVSLKPDYSNALYNLAVVLRDKGSFQEGAVIAEKLVSNLSSDTNSKDYQTASALLAELKSKAPSTSQPTTATTSASLENQNLPKVLDLPQPTQIATPPAVKK